VHLVRFIIRIYHDARSPELQKSSICIFLIPNFTQSCKKYKMYRQYTFTLFKWSETATDAISTKLALTRRHFINIWYTECINDLIAIQSLLLSHKQRDGQMDGRDIHMGPTFLLDIEGNILIYMGWEACIMSTGIRFSIKGRISHMKCSPMELTYSTAFMLHAHYCHNSSFILAEKKNFIFYEIRTILLMFCTRIIYYHSVFYKQKWRSNYSNYKFAWSFI